MNPNAPLCPGRVTLLKPTVLLAVWSFTQVSPPWIRYEIVIMIPLILPRIWSGKVIRAPYGSGWNWFISSSSAICLEDPLALWTPSVATNMLMVHSYLLFIQWWIWVKSAVLADVNLCSASPVLLRYAMGRAFAISVAFPTVTTTLTMFQFLLNRVPIQKFVETANALPSICVSHFPVYHFSRPLNSSYAPTSFSSCGGGGPKNKSGANSVLRFFSPHSSGIVRSSYLGPGNRIVSA